jgi:hypothetical protein
MIIWLAVVVPLLISGLVYVIFHHKVTFWELGIQIVVPFVLTFGAKSCVEFSQAQDTEYWGFYTTGAAYFEPWNEKVSCRHPIPCEHEIRCTHPEYETDSKGRRRRTGGYEHANDGYKHFNDGYYHPFDVDEHKPRWELYSSSGTEYSIGQSDFDRLCHQFGNRTFVELNRKFYTKDGDKYVTQWDPKQWDKVEPISQTRTYENRVQASKNVFNFPDVNPKDFGLYEYPAINGFAQQCVLGNAGASTTLGSKKIDYLNATLGAPHQIRLFVLVFKNQPVQAALDQESYWKGGNKNEFVTCIGVNDAYEVNWCRVFSWTEVDILKVEARRFVEEQKTLDLVAYADWLENAIPAKWQRRKFAEFSYLTIEPPTSAVVWTFVITILFNIGIAAFCLFNEMDPEHGRISFSDIVSKFHFKNRKEGAV